MRYRLELASRTDKGKVRTNNEDAMLTDAAMGLMVVADGMGGHKSGEVASRMAVEVLYENLKKMIAGNIRPEACDPKLSLRANQLSFCVQLANQTIHEAAKRYPQDQGMGTTLSAALLDENRLVIAHVGDSRIYLHRQGRLNQLTEDHSLVMDQIRKGLLSREEAEKSNLSNILLRAVGTEDKVEVDAAEYDVMHGDIFILCSDGLCKMARDEEISAVIRTAKEPPSICDTLIEMALSAGGSDNVTVIAAQVHAASGVLSQLKSSLGLGRKNDNA